jgi:hypothetical protein
MSSDQPVKLPVSKSPLVTRFWAFAATLDATSNKKREFSAHAWARPPAERFATQRALMPVSLETVRTLITIASPFFA